MNIQDIIKDPDYLGLPDTEKIKVINYILQKDDDFNGLPEEEKGKVRQYFIQSISGQPKAITRKFAEWKYSGIEKIEKQPVEQPAEQPEKQEHFIKTFTKEVVKPSIPEEEMPKWEQLARQEAKALLNITPYFLSFGATAPIQAGVRAGLIAKGLPTLARFAAPITHYATAFGIADAMKSLVKSMVSGDEPEGSVEKAGKEFVKGAVSSLPFGVAGGVVSNVARPLITSTKAIIDNLIEDGKIKKEELPNIALGMGIYASMSLLMDKTIPATLKQRAKADLAKETSEAIRRYNPSISQQEADLFGQMAARKIELEALYKNKPPVKTLEDALVFIQKNNPKLNFNVPQLTSGMEKAIDVISQLSLPPATTPIETPKIPIPPTTLPETQPIPLSGRPLTEAEQKQIDLQNKLKEIDKQFENKQKKLNKYSLWAYAKGKISPESVEALGYKIKDLEEEGIPRLFWKKGGAGIDKWIQENRYLITGSEGDTDEVKLVDNFISSLIQERQGKIVSIPHVEAFIDLQTEKETLKEEIRRQYGQEAEAIIPEIEKEVDNIPNNEIVAITNEPTEEDIKAVANELTDPEIAFIKNALANNQEVPPIFRKALEVREQLTPAPEQVQERAITQPVEPKKRGRPKKTQPPITEQPAPPIEQEVKQPETPPISPETQKEIADYSDYIQQKYKLSPELSDQIATEYITKDKKEWSDITRRIRYREDELMKRDISRMGREGYIPTTEGESDDYLQQLYEEGLGRDKLLGQAGKIRLNLLKTEPTNTKDMGYSLPSVIINSAKKIGKDLQFYPEAPNKLKNDIRIELIGGQEKIIDKVYNKIQTAIFGGLDAEETKQAIDLIYAKDALSRVRVGKGDPNLTEEEALEILENIKKSIRNPEVFKAAERYKEISNHYFNDLVARGKLNPEDRIEDYVRHYTLDYPATFIFKRGLPRRLRISNRGYTKPAKGSTKEYREDAQSLLGQFLEIEHDNMVDDFIAKQARLYDVAPSLSDDLKIKLFGISEAGRIRQPKPNKVYEINGEKYIGFNPKSPFSRNIYRTEEGAQALGGYTKTYLIPQNVYDTFNNINQSFGALEPYVYAANRITGEFKRWAILTRFTSFNANNFVGDTNLALFFSPEPVKFAEHITPALKFLATNPQNYTPEQKAFNEFIKKNSILDSAFISTEIPHIRTANNPAQAILKKAQDISGWREAIDRTIYAHYLWEEGLKKGKADQVIALHDWIDTTGLPPDEALGKIGREILGDYKATSKMFNKLIRGALAPFYTWYEELSSAVWRYTRRHPIAGLSKLALLPVLSTAWNSTDKNRELEQQLPESVRERVHFILGEENGAIKVWSLQTPQDVLVGTKIFSIAAAQLNMYLNGEKTIEEAAKDTLKHWLVKEVQGGLNFLNPTIRFLRGWANGVDPYDKEPVFPADKSKLSEWNKTFHLMLYFQKCWTPLLTGYIRSYTANVPTRIAIKEMVKDFAGLPALGVREYEPKTEMVLENGKKYTWDDYKKIRDEEVFTAGILLNIQSEFIKSGLLPAEFKKSEEFKNEVRKWLKRQQGLNEEELNKAIKSFADRIDNALEKNPSVWIDWIDNKIKSAETPEEKAEWRKIKQKAKTYQLYMKTKGLSTVSKQHIREQLEKEE